jgi:hypothetical protein
MVECHLLHLAINSDQHLFSEDISLAIITAQQATQRRPSYSRSGLPAQLKTLKKKPIVAIHTSINASFLLFIPSWN